MWTTGINRYKRSLLRTMLDRAKRLSSSPDLFSKECYDMNQRLLSCGVFIDLKLAFDTVDHDVLLDKLNHYGFRGIIIS